MTAGRRASVKVETAYKVRLQTSVLFYISTYYALDSTEPHGEGDYVYPSPCHCFCYDMSRRGRPSLTCCHSHFDSVRRALLTESLFPSRHGEEGLPLLTTSLFPFRRDEEGLPLLFVSLFPFRCDEEGLPLLFVSLFLFRRSKEATPPLRTTPISTRQVPPHCFNIHIKFFVYNMYLVDFTPGLLKPVTPTHETRTRGHGYGYGFSWRYPGVTRAIH